MANGLENLSPEQRQDVEFFIPKNFQEEQRNKLFIRLSKNFTPVQLDEIEETALHTYKKDRNNYID